MYFVAVFLYGATDLVVAPYKMLLIDWSIDWTHERCKKCSSGNTRVLTGVDRLRNWRKNTYLFVANQTVDIFGTNSCSKNATNSTNVDKTCQCLSGVYYRRRRGCRCTESCRRGPAWRASVASLIDDFPPTIPSANEPDVVALLVNLLRKSSSTYVVVQEG